MAAVERPATAAVAGARAICTERLSTPVVASVVQTAPGLPYLQAYPLALQEQVRGLLARAGLGDWLLRKYPAAHAVRTDKALYQYTAELKARHLRAAGTLNKVLFDSKIHTVRHALGLHTSRSQVQGARLTARHEIRVASLFKQVPPEFLQMIVVHELAHLREREHNKAFYQLCCHMQPDYHQVEFDVRLYLTHLEQQGTPLWGQA